MWGIADCAPLSWDKLRDASATTTTQPLILRAWGLSPRSSSIFCFVVAAPPNPIPYTLHPTPYTLHPNSSEQAANERSLKPPSNSCDPHGTGNGGIRCLIT